METAEKLYITSFKPDTESHIVVNQDFCTFCKNKDCTKFCPANVFAISSLDEQLVIAHENCLECGACKIGCPFNAIQYSHPKSGYGLN